MIKKSCLLFFFGLTVQFTMAQALSPIQAVREIDEHFSEAHVAAIEANRASQYLDRCNIAKSFVHAGQLDDAIKNYEDALKIALPYKSYEDMLNKARVTLGLVDNSLVFDSRENGLDENHQESDRGTSSVESYSTSEAADRIDEMLAFLHENIVRDPARKSQLIGDLKYCRALVLEGSMTEATKSYHETIIQYLDPRWTSQLLGDIKDIIAKTDPSSAQRNQANPAIAIEPEAADQNAPTNTSSGTDAKPARATSGSDSDMSGTKATDHPILYFQETMEGRNIERIRIMEGHELMTYKKVTHNWGKEYYFINDEPTTVTEWLRVLNLYNNQE